MSAFADLWEGAQRLVQFTGQLIAFCFTSAMSFLATTIGLNWKLNKIRNGENSGGKKKKKKRKH
jgi:hypothetical protein